MGLLPSLSPSKVLADFDAREIIKWQGDKWQRAKPHSTAFFFVRPLAYYLCLWWLLARSVGYTQELLHQRNTHSHAPAGREGKGTSLGAALGVSLGVSVPPATLPVYVDGSFRALPHLCNAIKEVACCSILRPPCRTLQSVSLSALCAPRATVCMACAFACLAVVCMRTGEEAWQESKGED
jgi:hypothetical protein